jgi:hypothetical protein
MGLFAFVGPHIEEPPANRSDLAGMVRVVASFLGIVRVATYSLISVTTLIRSASAIIDEEKTFLQSMHGTPATSGAVPIYPRGLGTMGGGPEALA